MIVLMMTRKEHYKKMLHDSKQIYMKRIPEGKKKGCTKYREIRIEN